MKIISLSILVAASLAASTATAIEPFKVKGKQLGQTAEAACGQAKITAKQDDFIAKYKSQLPDLRDIGSSECHVNSDTFGELKIAGGIDLLFLSNRLIQVKFDLVPMHWMEYGEIFLPLEEMYGKPVIEKRDSLTSHTWRQGNETLEISRTSDSSGVEALEIVLRDERSFQDYVRRTEENANIFQRLQTERTKSDLRD